MTVTRTPVNPWPWAEAFGFNQTELVERAGRVLVYSGQAAVSADGVPQHPETWARSSRSPWTTSRRCSGTPAWA